MGVWRDKPLHDWASHGADAFRYFATYQTKQQYATQLKVSMY